MTKIVFMDENQTRKRGNETRQLLLDAAIDVFGRDGFHAASTRAIAGAAGVNQALIGYHFGNKEGLYHAVFEYLSTRMAGDIRPLAAEILDRIENLDAESDARQDMAADGIESLIMVLATFFASEESPSHMRMILREQQDPTTAFETIYNGLMGQLLELIAQLVGIVLDQAPDEERTRVRTMMLMGNVLVFVIARGSISHFLGWERLQPKHLEELRIQLRAVIRAQLAEGLQHE